jgi:hypothetical protein
VVLKSENAAWFAKVGMSDSPGREPGRRCAAIHSKIALFATTTAGTSCAWFV